MKVPFTKILLWLLYFCQDRLCSRTDSVKRMGIQTPNNWIDEDLKNKGTFSTYYALFYWEKRYVGNRFPVFSGQKIFGLCGAVIIDQHHLLTAAHCVEYKTLNFDEYFVNMMDPGSIWSEAMVFFGNFHQELGVFDKTKFSQMLNAFLVEEIKDHRFFDRPKDYSRVVNDIAVLKVKGTFPKINQIRLCEPVDKLRNHILVMTGSGINENDNIFDPYRNFNWRLNSFKVDEISDKLFCELLFYPRVDPGSYICARGNTACLGDSGGPLVLAEIDDYGTVKPVCLYGIVSHFMVTHPIMNALAFFGLTRELCMVSDGNRYTSVLSYKKWILRNTK